MSMFKRRSLESTKCSQNVYEEECQRLKRDFELLYSQREEAVEIIRTVNAGITEVISSLQDNNPEPLAETVQINASLLTSLAAKVSDVDHTDGLDCQDDYFKNDEYDINSKSMKHNDKGLKTELVILQSMVNRLRTEQIRLTNSLKEKNDKEKEKIQKSHSHRRSKVFTEGNE
ncbi:14394_t:CDS:1 [Dentiscutata erythropus]|uniref:14394_t:CDS:1 n=1 Tax=Dentiscutata erythropus TaxID=1348616 RepID=A0A9N9E4W0_9GLOM|nr:14394_t:CDS:1 [Dentiscutata erythropus]